MSKKDIKEKSTVCEIERNFQVPNDYHRRLEGLGFQLMKTHESLLDVYFDVRKSIENKDPFAENSDYPLLRNDHWLRKRNGKWELKYAIKTTTTKINKNGTTAPEILHKGSRTDMYHETSDKSNILSRITAIPTMNSNNYQLA